MWTTWRPGEFHTSLSVNVGGLEHIEEVEKRNSWGEASTSHSLAVAATETAAPENSRVSSKGRATNSGLLAMVAPTTTSKRAAAAPVESGTLFINHWGTHIPVPQTFTPSAEPVNLTAPEIAETTLRPWLFLTLFIPAPRYLDPVIQGIMDWRENPTNLVP